VITISMVSIMPPERRDECIPDACFASMDLQYLIFDFSDEESGRGSFDAMASVLPARLPALLSEIEAVLQWASSAFGAAAAPGDEGEWDEHLQGTEEPDTPLAVRYDAVAGRVLLAPSTPGKRVTLALTLSGSRAFCDAFREAFCSSD
jgi:hypothetical protein